MSNKKSKKPVQSKSKNNVNVKIYNISDIVHAIAKLQKSKKSIMLHILERDIGPCENILKDSFIKYSRTKMQNGICRLELFATQEKRKSLDDIVSEFMSQFEEM